LDQWQPSTLGWSISRKTHFESCRRHYFYHRFWGQNPKLKWKLYEMRNITTLKMMEGSVVHSVIAEALRSTRLGINTTPEIARHNVTGLLRSKYMESQRRVWHFDNRPQGRKLSDITNLFEHYYNVPNVHERAREAQKHAWTCVDNLFGSDLWQQIVDSDKGSWMEVEDGSFPSFELDGILVWAKPDFALSAPNPTIIDWKTGRPAGSERTQLALYSLYAARKWDWNPLETDLKAVFLHPELTEEAFRPTEIDIEQLREFVRGNFEEMMKLEPAYGPADIELFPKTDNLTDCAWCRFRGMCRPLPAEELCVEPPEGEV